MQSSEWSNQFFHNIMQGRLFTCRIRRILLCTWRICLKLQCPIFTAPGNLHLFGAARSPHLRIVISPAAHGDLRSAFGHWLVTMSIARLIESAPYSLTSRKDSGLYIKRKIMKRLVICCDGTWNSADQMVDGELCPTNVVRSPPVLAKQTRKVSPRLFTTTRA